ncbi:MAG: EamA family transporter RarD [Actinomycetota bacterium]|nr:EamA family transporter RarD [Actinomycetota bacterium]
MHESTRQRDGFLAAAAAYGLWGLLPAYFVALDPSGPVEILALRIVLSLVFCLVILAVMRRLSRTTALLRDRNILKLSALAAVLILINWSVYVYASLNQFIVEAALGYFINPLVTVALGVIVLKEKLRPLQWGALSLAVAAVVVLAVGYGSVPVISLTLAFSFGFYGFVKNRMGPAVKSLDSLTLETLWLTPIALGLLGWVYLTSGLSLGTLGPWHTALLLMAGAVTSIPLLFFGAAARRLPLSVIGLMQYLAPIMQFTFGVAIMGEPMPLERWIGFSLVWVALVILSVDALSHRRNRLLNPANY